MVNVVLQTVDLDVFGGPTSLNVSTDFGKTGTRGTRVWVGDGPPERELTTQDINLYDLYINTNSFDDYYSWLYQYVPSIGSPVWERVLKLNQQQYSSTNLITFSEGTSVLNIPMANITKDTALTTSRFIVRYSFENGSYNQTTPAESTGFPIASSFTYGLPVISGVRYLQIVFKAAAFDGSDWNALEGSHKVHTFVSYLGVGV
jgi:hypothetical protein